MADAGRWMQEALRASRVSLNEQWTMYIVSVSAGMSPAKTLADELRHAYGPTHFPDTIATSPAAAVHAERFLEAIAALASGEDTAAATAAMGALKESVPGGMSDEVEAELASMAASLQGRAWVPGNHLDQSISNVEASLAEMRGAMLDSITAGLEGLKDQLQAIHWKTSETKEISLHILDDMGWLKEVLLLMLGSGCVKDEDLPSGEWRQRVMQLREDQAGSVIQGSLPTCPTSGVPFRLEGSQVPTLVPGCDCTVSRSTALLFQQLGKCGVCSRPVTRGAPLKPDDAALQILEDMRDRRMPALHNFDMERDFQPDPDNEGNTREGTEGTVCFGTLEGQRVAVKTVVFGYTSELQRRRRCRQYVLMNAIHIQQKAAVKSEYNCKIVGVSWTRTRAHIAMPMYKCSLEEHLQNLPQGLPHQELLQLCVDLTRAVHAVHECGILHCDIKPSNVLMADDGSPRLIDFGLSIISKGQLQSRTAIGHTPNYAAPEQIQGRASPATDIYSLGCTLAFAATGIVPSPSANGPVVTLPEEPYHLRRQLQQMTGDNEIRRNLQLDHVLSTFVLMVENPAALPAPVSFSSLALQAGHSLQIT